MTDNTTTPPAPWITSRALLLLQATIIVSILPFLQWGRLGLPASILLAIYGCLQLSKGNGLVKGIVLVMVVITLLFALLISTPNHSALAVESQNNLKQFAIALENYKIDHGHYPPPYTTDENGKPLHSWRVLILPHVGEKKLYEKFDLAKPWYHPKNLALADQMPHFYRSPAHFSERDKEPLTTAYVAILGENTAWPHSGTRKSQDIVDGLSNTVLLVESEKHRMHWMSTGDPGIESLGPTGGNGETLLTHGPPKRGFLCVLCNGAVRWLGPDYPFDDFLSLLTIDGGETHVIPD